MIMVFLRLRSEISLPIMKELVPHYLQDTSRVCSMFEKHFEISIHCFKRNFLTVLLVLIIWNE